MASADSSIAQEAWNGEQFRRLMRDGFSEGNLAVVDELFAPDFVEHQAGVRPPNAEGVKGLIAYLRQAIPDLTCAIEDMVAAGDRVWARVRGRGTHGGTFMGQAPTGRPIEVHLIDVCRFAGSKIVEHWGGPDRQSILEQLEARPRAQQGTAQA